MSDFDDMREDDAPEEQPASRRGVPRPSFKLPPRDPANEVMPFVPRGRVLPHVGGALGVWLLLMIILIAIGSGRRNTQITRATQQVVQQTEVVQTQIASADSDATTNAIAASTQGAILALTASPTATLSFNVGATLPPTWTPTAEAVAEVVGEEIQPTALPPIPPEIQSGILVGYGGNDALSDGYIDAYAFEMSQPESPQIIGSFEVNSIDINPVNGQTIVYTRYFPSQFEQAASYALVNGSQAQGLAVVWGDLETIRNSGEARYSATANSIVFTARALNNSREVYVIDLRFRPGVRPIRRITNDDDNYRAPSISPDGTQVLAVKTDETGLNPSTDLVLIDVQTGQQQPLTTDGNALIEMGTAWNPVDQTIVYTAAEGSEDGPQDMIRINLLNEAEPAIPVIRSANVDERNPVFDPEGRYLAYSSNRSGVYNIYIRDLETGTDYQLTDSTRDPFFPGGWYRPEFGQDTPPLIPLPTPNPEDQTG